MALGWLLHRCGVLTAAETSSQSHSALGACASALAEQDLSRSTDTARQVGPVCGVGLSPTCVCVWRSRRL